MTFAFDSRQQALLDQAARQKEAMRLRPIMRENLVEATAALDDAALLAHITAALGRVAAWGVRQRGAATDFVILWLLLGPDFDRAPAIGRLFSPGGPGTPGIDAKVRALMAELQWKMRTATDQEPR